MSRAGWLQQHDEGENQVAATSGRKRLLQFKAMTTMKELFARRHATEPGSKEEDQTVDRVMKAMFPEPDAKDPALALQAAYEKFVNTAKGTPEHEQARDELTDALFVNAK